MTSTWRANASASHSEASSCCQWPTSFSASSRRALTATRAPRRTNSCASTLLGPNNLLAAVIPPMVRSGSGRVVGIASVAGYRGLAGAEAYGATKAAQMQLLKGLRAVADGLERRRTEIVFPLPMAATMKLARLVPVGLWGALTSRMGNPAQR